MKYSIAIILVSLFCSPAFAVETCTAKIDRLESLYKADGPMISGGKVEEFRAHLAKAKEAQKDGDLETCNNSANRAQQIYDLARSK